MLRNEAPCGDITFYDQRHLALYAVLLDADAAGNDWRHVAATFMNLDPEGVGSELCWRSHLERARWIVSEGLAEACTAFGSDRGSFQH